MDMSITLRTILDFKKKEFLFEGYKNKKLNCHYWNVNKEKSHRELIINNYKKDNIYELEIPKISKPNILLP